MTLPLAERALIEIACRLSKIRKGDNYKTDAGLTVLRARRKVAPEECPCVVIWDQGETITEGGSDRTKVRLSITVDGHTPCDQDDTGHAIECLKADIKRAVLSGVKGALTDGEGLAGQIGALAITGCSVVPREEQSTTESMSVSFEVSYLEGYGNPYNAQPRSDQ